MPETYLGPFGQSIRGVNIDGCVSKGAIGAHLPRSSINCVPNWSLVVQYELAVEWKFKRK